MRCYDVLFYYAVSLYYVVLLCCAVLCCITVMYVVRYLCISLRISCALSRIKISD